jgi:hypothetical protein
MEIETINNNSSNINFNPSTKLRSLSPYEEDKPRKKRRSKKDPNGRMFICHCGKGYLSKLALNNHTKSKHLNIGTPNNFHRISSNLTYFNNNSDTFVEGNNNAVVKKKRGRPKKTYGILYYDELFYNSFFHNIKRQKPLGYIFSYDRFIIYSKEIFKNIFIDHKQFCSLSNLTSSIEHPIIEKLINNKKQFSSFTCNKINNCDCCDDIFIQYILLVSSLTNEEYFKFVFSFVLLLRECINKYKNIEVENSKEVLNEKNNKVEFTQIYDAEQIPEICNEFLTEFLTNADYFGIDNEYKGEFQLIIQHFCFWLYQNNFTSSKLIINHIKYE